MGGHSVEPLPASMVITGRADGRSTCGSAGRARRRARSETGPVQGCNQRGTVETGPELKGVNLSTPVGDRLTGNQRELGRRPARQRV